MSPVTASTRVELGAFGPSHRVWKVVAGLSVAAAAAVFGLGLAWNQLTLALWLTVGFSLVFAAFTWSLTLIVQRHLWIESRGLVRASAIREKLIPWPEIGRARVGLAELGQRLPSLIIEGVDGRIRGSYGHALINRPLEEAARLINERVQPTDES